MTLPFATSTWPWLRMRWPAQRAAAREKGSTAGTILSSGMLLDAAFAALSSASNQVLQAVGLGEPKMKSVIKFSACALWMLLIASCGGVGRNMSSGGGTVTATANH